jgi:hypothetical protein
MLLGLVEAKLENVPLNQSVVFMKESDIIMMSDHRHAVIHFYLTPCIETRSILQGDLLAIKEVAEKPRHSVNCVPSSRHWSLWRLRLTLSDVSHPPVFGNGG